VIWEDSCACEPVDLLGPAFKCSLGLRHLHKRTENLSALTISQTPIPTSAYQSIPSSWITIIHYSFPGQPTTQRQASTLPSTPPTAKAPSCPKHQSRSLHSIAAISSAPRVANHTTSARPPIPPAVSPNTTATARAAQNAHPTRVSGPGK
jgi:hypothetical protein